MSTRYSEKTQAMRSKISRCFETTTSDVASLHPVHISKYYKGISFVMVLLRRHIDPYTLMTIIKDYNQGKKKPLNEVVEFFEAVRDEDDMVDSIIDLYKIKLNK